MENFRTFSACRECSALIHHDAKTCSNCGATQGTVKGYLTGLAGIAGGLSLLWAVLTYGISNLPAVKRVMFGRDSLTLISASTYSGVAVANDGDYPIFLISIFTDIKSPNGAEIGSLIPINRLLKPGEVYTSENRDLAKESEENKKWGNLVVNSEAEWDNFFSSLFEQKKVDNCAGIIFLNAEEPVLHLFETHRQPKYAKVIDVPTKITFFSLHDKTEKNIDVKAHAYMMYKTTPECTSKTK